MDPLICVAIIIAFCGGLYVGHEKGVKDTEERWSDAVAKANYHRDLEKAQ